MVPPKLRVYNIRYNSIVSIETTKALVQIVVQNKEMV